MTDNTTPGAGDPGPIPDSLDRKPPKTLEFHALAELFPLLEGPAMDGLIDDIRHRGQQEPVWLYAGKIIDGRNRYLACQKLNRETKVRDYVGDDPIGFVLGVNLHRRHLNESQRAMIAAKLTSLEVGANQHTKGEGVSTDTASKLLNVGRASIFRAKKVLAAGDQALIAAVDKGNVSVTAAANTATKKTGGKKSQSWTAKKRQASAEQLMQQIGNFEAEWEQLNGSQKRHFVKTNQHELDELLQELAAMPEEPETNFEEKEGTEDQQPTMQ
jgi:ParB-like chromosome segregation protein Spo0J